ncbi:hypothetical protein E4T66_01385 [Sinimarinibacterium sp. CAU 1509]|uniref:DUF6455 family protein n=1 Tax=Sinimarinibacterium sp. CAU 1509 TaxID=2562283 RepID=UPI00113DAA64|nr:DUF6455 family protein [Sinimarinibacterium sp. CAU 1509]TJY64910.1 hypothetical protein E4T66_01385 [Sinimarinibacterium sp. CAU 1509]
MQTMTLFFGLMLLVAAAMLYLAFGSWSSPRTGARARRQSTSPSQQEPGVSWLLGSPLGEMLRNRRIDVWTFLAATPGAQIESAVANCLRCPFSGRCDRPESRRAASTPPSFCLNRDAILRALHLR